MALSPLCLHGVPLLVLDVHEGDTMPGCLPKAGRLTYLRTGFEGFDQLVAIPVRSEGADHRVNLVTLRQSRDCFLSGHRTCSFDSTQSVKKVLAGRAGFGYRPRTQPAAKWAYTPH